MINLKLGIENFIGEISLPKASLGFIEEGILCYKVGAYRSAYIMSYLFLLNVVKYRVIESSSTPNGITEGEWNAKKKKISNEEIWEKNVYDLICEMKNDQSRYFKISKTRVAQMEYWRSLRNDCAHSKDNLIAASHVESLWLFIESILPKLVINGSKEFLMKELEAYFDNAYFNYSNKVQEIVESLPHLAENNDIAGILKEIHQIFKQQSNYKINNPNGRAFEFWRAINVSTNKPVFEGFNKFITSSNEVFSQFIFLFPNRFTLVLENHSIISYFINKELPEALKFDFPNAVEILFSCLRNGLIESNHSQKYMSYVDCDLKQLGHEHLYLLKSHGYFENFKKKMMSDLYRGKSFSYSKINGNSVDLAYFIKYCILTDQENKEFIVLLNNTLKTLDNETVFAELKEVLINNSTILDFLKRTLDHEKEDLCDFLKNL